VNSVNPRAVLVYRLGSLGDTVVALPCFHLIKRRFPDAKITLLTNRPVASAAAPAESILGRGYFFDDVLEYPCMADSAASNSHRGFHDRRPKPNGNCPRLLLFPNVRRAANRWITAGGP
jgi:hypothetical protein